MITQREALNRFCVASNLQLKTVRQLIGAKETTLRGQLADNKVSPTFRARLYLLTSLEQFAPGTPEEQTALQKEREDMFLPLEAFIREGSKPVTVSPLPPRKKAARSHLEQLAQFDAGQLVDYGGILRIFENNDFRPLDGVIEDKDIRDTAKLMLMLNQRLLMMISLAEPQQRQAIQATLEAPYKELWKTMDSFLRQFPMERLAEITKHLDNNQKIKQSMGLSPGKDL